MNTRALAAMKPGEELTPFTFDRREMKKTDIDFTVSYAGICH